MDEVCPFTHCNASPPWSYSFLTSYVTFQGKGNRRKDKHRVGVSSLYCKLLSTCCWMSCYTHYTLSFPVYQQRETFQIQVLYFARYELEQWEAVAASPVAVTTAGELRPSVCRVVIYLQRDMSGDSWLPQHHTQSSSTSTAPPLACPKTKDFSHGGAVGLGNKYVRLNVGGTLFYTTLHVLTRQNSLLKAMFSGKKAVFTDREGRPTLKCLTELQTQSD